jgi:hypothetical protein
MVVSMPKIHKVHFLAAAPVILVLTLAGCGVPSDRSLGESVEISDATLTVTAIEEGTADDIAELELDELDGQTPYFVRFDVTFDDGAEHEFDSSLWKADASTGKASPVRVIQITDQFDCAGLDKNETDNAEGCQLIMVEPGATLESVSYAAYARWAGPK